MSGLEWTPDVSIYRQPWRESTGACLQAPAGEGITMTDVGLEALGFLTTSEVAALLKCSPKKVTRLAAEGEIQKVKLGALSRYTPESVAAYKRRLIEQAQAAKAS
jgi:excisionase family DNA binding protein